MEVAENPLVGREAELAALEQALDDAVRGRPTAFELRGEPGIGKSRLLDEIARRARERGLRVLGGHATELESDLPFGTIADALAHALDDAPTPAVRRVLRERAGELASVLPELGTEAPRLSAERYEAHRAICALIAALAEKRPLLLTFDDLHWADPASLELVAHLLRRPLPRRLVVVLAYRPRQAPPALARALSSSRAGRRPLVLEPGPLSAEEAEALLGDLPADERAEVHRESLGNPLAIELLARCGPGPARRRRRHRRRARRPAGAGRVARARGRRRRRPVPARPRRGCGGAVRG